MWKDLELNPTYKGYVELEHEMEVVRAAAAQFIGCGTEEVVLEGGRASYQGDSTRHPG